jgi:hypothetical protein
MTRFRPALLLSLCAAVTFVFAACGGDDESGGGGASASSSTDVNELLTQTFTGSKDVDSGNVDLELTIEAQGAEGLEGPVSIALAGPFQIEDPATLPKFKFDFSLEGAGQSIQAGATSTGDKGFVSFQGTDYEVSDQVFRQFKAGYEEAQKQGQDANAQSFASLGMDPRKWLTDPKNEGDAKVGDDDTIKITGGVDVAALLDDINNALSKASSLGLSGTADVPEKLTAEQRQAVLDAVKEPHVEIYTGKDDQILRRLVVNLGVQAEGTTGTVAFDVSITDLNEDQEIAEPADAKPFDELLSQLGGLGLGGLGASGGGASGSGSGSGTSADDLEKFSQCIEEAGNDAAKAQECSALLTP